MTTRAGGARELQATHRIGLGPLKLDAVVERVGIDRAGPRTSAAAVSDEKMPATVRDAVAARVDSLGNDVAATLRVAASAGADYDLDLIPRVAGMPVVEVLAHLDLAEGAGLVVEHGSRFRFRHELIREALEAATGAARRSFIQRQAAGVLAGRPDPDPLAVAVHARAGGDQRLASSWLGGRSRGRRRPLRPPSRRAPPGRCSGARAHPRGLRRPGSGAHVPGSRSTPPPPTPGQPTRPCASAPWPLPGESATARAISPAPSSTWRR